MYIVSGVHAYKQTSRREVLDQCVGKPIDTISEENGRENERHHRNVNTPPESFALALLEGQSRKWLADLSSSKPKPKTKAESGWQA
eukprot:scaffold347638_cov21-Prasinocladus_malaysianus.AAC.1